MLQEKTLKDSQSIGQWPVVESHLLKTKYIDRFQKASELFEVLSTDVFESLNYYEDELPIITNWKDDDLPNKIYSTRHEGPCFGFDIDYMAGPHDWEHEDDPIGDYVVRKKCYIYDWTGEKLEYAMPELKYFIEMHNDFLPIMNEGKKLFPRKDIKKWLHKLMVIEYSTPTATDENVMAHREFNTNRFGDSHCDETFAGLHLGENYIEFQAKNTFNGNWEYIDGLEDSSMLWMFGEDAQSCNWIPTYHRMIPGMDTLGTRYSIIFDLQGRT